MRAVSSNPNTTCTAAGVRIPRYAQIRDSRTALWLTNSLRRALMSQLYFVSCDKSHCHVRGMCTALVLFIEKRTSRWLLGLRPLAEERFHGIGKAVSRKGLKNASTIQIRAFWPQRQAQEPQQTRPYTEPWLYERGYGRARMTMTSSFGPCDTDSVSTEDSLETCDSCGWYSVARRGRRAPRYSWVGHGR